MDLAIALLLAILALAVRLPHLWTVPRFTDETLEVLHSLAIARDGALPLTNYDSYYGALYNYLIAAAIWTSGGSPLAPRAAVLIVGAATVGLTYYLGRDLYRSVCADDGRRPGLAGRGAGVLAALILATNGAHVVVNSHVAWSNCLTPLFTTFSFLMLIRCVAGPDCKRTGAAASLLMAGLMLGLALQTHPLVAAILPGAAIYIAWKAPALLRTPWPYAAVLLFLLSYANVIVYNVESGWETVRSAQRIRAEYALDQQASVGYVSTLGAMGLLLARVLGGAIDQRGGPMEYLADPAVILACVLAACSVVWLARRGQPLPLLISLTFLLLLPALNPKFRTLITSRYLMPIVPLVFAAVAAFLVGGSLSLVGQRLEGAASPRRTRWMALGCVLVAAILVVVPLGSLWQYYVRAFERSDTNERILRLTDEIVAARSGPDEPVLVDDSMGVEMPDTGVTELRGFEHLLTFARVAYRTTRVSPGRLQDELRGSPSALVVLNARDAAAASERVVVTPLDPRAPAETGRASDYRLYRITPKTIGALELPNHRDTDTQRNGESAISSRVSALLWLVSSTQWARRAAMVT